MINKKIVLLAVVVLVVVAGGLLFFYKNKITDQPQPVIQNNSQTQSVALSILDDKDFTGSVKTESYKMGSVEFRMYNSADIIKSPGYFEVYEGVKKIFASKPNYKIGGLLAFAFGENTYVVVKDYSGGAHCCDTDYLFRINVDSQVKLIKTFDMGNMTISKDSLLVKNNKLYLALLDDSFQYFHVAYVDSYFFTQYYQLNGDVVVSANKDFAPDLIKTAEDCRDKIIHDTKDTWLNDFLCYAANYALVGKQDAAMADFNGFFNKFFPSDTGKDAFGEVIKRDALKQEIIDTLKNDRFN